jgi:hypothetical protein
MVEDPVAAAALQIGTFRAGLAFLIETAKSP